MTQSLLRSYIKYREKKSERCEKHREQNYQTPSLTVIKAV